MPLTRREKKSARTGRRRRFGFELRLLWSVLLAGFPATVLGLIVLWRTPYSRDHQLEGTVLLLVCWLGMSISTRNAVVRSIQVLSNVIAAVREEDFSFRATETVPGDAFGELAIEINGLARALEEERLCNTETANMLRKIMDEAGAAIFTFSPDRRLQLINRAGMAFLAKPEEQVVGRSADELGIANLMDVSISDTISRSVSGIERRWIVRQTHFRQGGVPHLLLLLSEASEALKAEERQAWQRIIRVLGHEINNSLAPIKSIAHTLARQSSGSLPQEGMRENLQRGLAVIEDRAESLNRFLQGYARLAKLPAPSKGAIAFDDLVAHIVSLETRLQVRVLAGPRIYINVDADQIEQAIINLIGNAVDAVLLSKVESSIEKDAVTMSWAVEGNDLEFWIRDRAHGLIDTQNLFVPFYTTKLGGSGIGLILSRQIIEAHSGSLKLRNCTDHPGCEVQVRLPSCISSDQPQNVYMRLPE